MGIIYFIKCLETGEVYIGSTRNKLQKRMGGHRCHTNSCRSKQIIERGNYFYDTLEVVEDDKDILIRENYYIKTMKNCINEVKAYRSPEERKEYNKQWKKENKEKITEYNKQWKIENKEQREEYITEWKKENKEKIKEYQKQSHEYKSSWGGDPRYHNNLLNIDINIFHDR